MAAKTSEATEALKQLTYLAAALKAPRITEAAARLADHARDAAWTDEEYLTAVLDREVAARNASCPATDPGCRVRREEDDREVSTGTPKQLCGSRSYRSRPAGSSPKP